MAHTSINGRGTDDDDEMARAFEAFMLQGTMSSTAKENKSALAESRSSKKKKKKKKSSLSSSSGISLEKFSTANEKANNDSTTPSAASPSQTASKQPAKKIDAKRHHQLLRLFNDKIQNVWFNIDDQLLSVLQNILNIRGRLPLEWKVLHSSEITEDHVSEQEQDSEWKYNGFLGKPKELPYSFHLHVADVELALSHDLTQHEKMLAGVRSLMFNLAECHQSLGRVLDTLWKFHLECTAEHENEIMQKSLNAVTDVFHLLSMELYRKQGLVPLIQESINDKILGIDSRNGRGMMGSGNNGHGSWQEGLKTVRMCCESWPRSSEESYIDEDYFSEALKTPISRS